MAANVELTEEVRETMRQGGAYKVRISNPATGFAHALPGCHPRDVMPDCRAVVVGAVAVGARWGEHFFGLWSHDEGRPFLRLERLIEAAVFIEVKMLLRKSGYRLHIPRGYVDDDRAIANLSAKLCGHEAGVGVYGKCGVVVTPEYGPRVWLAVALTDAPLVADGPLRDFNPCAGCTVCAEVCPVGAVEPDAPPPRGHRREVCVPFIFSLREPGMRLSGRLRNCERCFQACPVGRDVACGFTQSGFLSLSEVEAAEREGVVREVLRLARFAELRKVYSAGRVSAGGGD